MARRKANAPSVKVRAATEAEVRQDFAACGFVCRVDRDKRVWSRLDDIPEATAAKMFVGGAWSPEGVLSHYFVNEHGHVEVDHDAMRAWEGLNVDLETGEALAAPLWERSSSGPKKQPKRE